jgi:hypothetical protein
MSVSEDLLCSFELLKVGRIGASLPDLGSCMLIPDIMSATRWSGIEEGDGQEQAEKVSLTVRQV